MSFLNLFRDSKLNQDPTQKGFFEKDGRVRAIKMLKGTVKSQGFLLPFERLQAFSEAVKDFEEGLEFDTVGKEVIVKKYEVEEKKVPTKFKKGRGAKISRLVNNQFHFHCDTLKLQNNIRAIKPEDEISITAKYHGSNSVLSNILTKVKPKWYHKLYDLLGIDYVKTKYDDIYASRRVVKNQDYIDSNQKGYYKEDIWYTALKDKGLFGKIPKGFTIYGEIVGFTPSGQYIQKGYDYGCEGNESDIYVFRVTHTNADGLVTELNYSQIKQFCEQLGIKVVDLYYQGKASDFVGSTENFHEDFYNKIQELYLEKDCTKCKNDVPDEGVVVRVEDLFECKVFKAKSFRFLEQETKSLDKGESSIEDQN